MQLHIMTAVAVSFALCVTPTAQDSFPGFERTDIVRPAGAYTVLASGDILSFNGTAVERQTADGLSVATIAVPATMDFPNVFTSFLTVSPDETTALVGRTGCNSDFSNCNFGDVWWVDLVNLTAQAHDDLPNNFDGALASSTTGYVSVKSCGFGCPTAEVVRVELGAPGFVDEVSYVGASGPIALAPSGDLVIGTVSNDFPPPAAGSEVYRFSAGDLGGATVLTEADGELVATGLIGAAAMQFDAATGDLFLLANRYQTTPQNEDITENLLYLIEPQGDVEVLFEGELGWTLGNLVVTPSNGVARLFRYQPAEGGRFSFRGTNYTTFASTDREYAPRRPELEVTSTGSTATVTVAGGGAGNVGLVFYRPAGSVLSPEVPVTLGGLSHAPWFFGLDPTVAVIDFGAIVFDANGDGAKSYAIPPTTPPATFAAQLMVLEGAVTPIGTSNVAIL